MIVAPPKHSMAVLDFLVPAILISTKARQKKNEWKKAIGIIGGLAGTCLSAKQRERHQTTEQGTRTER